MSASHLTNQENLPALTDEAVIRIISQELPRWKAACDNPAAEIVILNQRAFGNSDHELFLLSIAVRYAGIAKKHVTITA